MTSVIHNGALLVHINIIIGITRKGERGMDIPKLNKSNRSREYNDYSEAERAAVVHAWLFSDMTHREIDHDILQLDPEYSRGWQSMGILHYLGLKKNFHGLFTGLSPDQAIKQLVATGDASYKPIIDYLMKCDE